MRAVKTTTDKGYVVCIVDNHTSVPVRNFGWFQSAAIELCNLINHRLWKNKSQDIARWIKTYDPERIYTYPELKGSNVILKTQRNRDTEQ